MSTTVDPNFSVLATLRRPTATADELEAALKSIDVGLAEAVVDQLEADRQAMLLRNAGDAELDLIEGKIKTANRDVERLAAARDQLPGRIASRKSTEHAVTQRSDAARKRLLQAFEAMAEIHGLAVKMVELLGVIRKIEGEISASNLDASDAGMYEASVSAPLAALANHLRCPISQLPDLSIWGLSGYTAPVCRDDRLLSRAAELLTKPATAKAA